VVEPAATTPRWSLCALCGAYAACLFWCAFTLPWRSLSAFALLTAALGLANLALALLAALRQRWLGHAWRALAWATLGYFLWLTWQVVTSALYLQQIYGSLGQGVALLLLLALVLLGGVTLPVAIWWFVRERRQRRERRVALGAAIAFSCAVALRAGVDRAAPTAFPLPGLSPRALEAAMKSALPAGSARTAASLFGARAVECVSLDPARAAGVVSFVAAGTRVASACVSSEPAELLGELTRRVRGRAERGPVKLDIVSRAQALRAQPGLLGPLVDSLSLRPGLDGVCFRTRCLMPWQLVVSGVFAHAAPVPFADQLKLGASLSEIRTALGAPPGSGSEGLVRIETRSLLVGASGVAHELVRGAQIARAPNRANLRAAVDAAQLHLRRAQQKDGGFRYELDMFRGEGVSENPSIPRHAGTVLVVCELAENERRTQRLVRRALGVFERWERRAESFGALVRNPGDAAADLGSTALGLVALLECRRLVGARYDGLIGRLGRLLLELEDDVGSFRPGYDFGAARALEGPTPLFAGGQAIMALSLLEKLARDEPKPELPARAELQAAVERAMDYVAESYWPSPLADFFYLKENWHCLAARASLGHHRHDAYERFCLDYVEFKSRRFIVDAASDVDPDYHGGFNFSNLVPPHNGSSAGVGEALAAAIDIKRARGEDAAALVPRLESVLAFLLQRQLLEDNCFACRDQRLAWGGFTGESVGPDGRIDHVQHALSALADGARQLF